LNVNKNVSLKSKSAHRNGKHLAADKLTNPMIKVPSMNVVSMKKSGNSYSPYAGKRQISGSRKGTAIKQSNYYVTTTEHLNKSGDWSKL
jgi:hypothetical protein